MSLPRVGWKPVLTLIGAIRVTKDVDSIKALRAVTRETIERMEERKRQEELKRLQGTSVTTVALPEK